MMAYKMVHIPVEAEAACPSHQPRRREICPAGMQQLAGGACAIIRIVAFKFSSHLAPTYYARLKMTCLPLALGFLCLYRALLRTGVLALAPARTAADIASGALTS